jgi:tetratricopeptide (TPR) repeat protein
MYSERAKTLEEAGQLDKAIAEYRLGLAPSGNALIMQVNLGYALAKNRQYDAAREVADQLDQSTSDKLNGKLVRDGADLWEKAYLVVDANERGNREANKGNPKAALRHYNLALKADPGNAVIYFNRGRAHFDLNEFSEAIANFDSALRLRPDYALAANAKKETLGRLERLKEAALARQEANRKAEEQVKANLCYACKGTGKEYRPGHTEIEFTHSVERTVNSYGETTSRAYVSHGSREVHTEGTTATCSSCRGTGQAGAFQKNWLK